MKAIRYHGVGDVRVEDVPPPSPAPGELLLTVATTGICGTDLGEYVHDPIFMPVAKRHPYSGHGGPTIPGHEFSGHVAAVGEGVSGFSAGDLVGVGAGVSCGRCPMCLQGHTNLCRVYWSVGLHANGGLAELATVPASCVLNLADRDLSADLAALAQPMAIAVHAVRRGRAGGDDRVVVLGTGGIGAFIVHAATLAGGLVTAVDLDPDRLEVARRMGAAETVNASRPEELSTLEAAEPTLVFEATGRPDSLQRGLALTSQRGRLVVVGHQPAPVALDVKLVSMGEREIIGTMAQAFTSDFSQAVEWISDDPEAWVAVAPTVYPLDQVVTAGLDPMARGESPQIKMLFDPAIDGPRPLRTA